MSLDCFFKPKSIAVIGASHDEKKIGYVILESLACCYKGKIYPINPNTEPIMDMKVYASILDVPGEIDMAVISIPAKLVPSVLKECVKKNIGAVVIVSGGFSEIGNKKLERDLHKIIRGTKTRVIGPNCLGIYDTNSDVDTIFLSRGRCGRPNEGNISFVSQSGAVGSTILDWLSDQETGVGRFVSYGNGVDVTESDLIEYFGDDKNTGVIAVYLEGIKDDGRRFIEVCKKVSRKKPIVILKAGKSEKGKEAVSSHTGSLAGSGKIYSGAFRQAGIIEAEDWEDLFDFSRAFSNQPRAKGKRTLIVTDGGGFGVLATDEAERSKLEPSAKLKKRLEKKLPEHAVIQNPIDLTGDANADRYMVTLEETMKSGEFDNFVVITLFQVTTLDEHVVDYLIKLKKYKKPIVVCSTGGGFSQKMNKKLRKNGIPVTPSPERALRTIAALNQYSKYLSS
jgi:acetyl coenzyme A synthetase (ADP forming)-like protein